jgi:hypothetical protein
MSRYVQYQQLAFVDHPAASPSNTQVNWQTHNPEVFAKPFPVQDQQFTIHLDEQIATPFVASGPERFQIEQFAKPFPVASQQDTAPFWRGNVPTAFQKEGWRGYQLDYAFAKPFPVQDQQYDAMPWQGLVPTATTPEGWQGQQLEIRFAQPFPVAEQQFQTWLAHPIPIKAFPGWEGIRLDYAFAKPFPVEQQWFDQRFQPRGKILSTFFEGWRPQEFDYLFAKPNPAFEQLHVTHLDFGVPSTPEPYGWWGLQYEIRFAQPFPVAEQQFAAWPAQIVPPYLPPGSGKRRDFPYPEYPQPARDQKPNKPFRPIWDRGPVKVEIPKAPERTGPPPPPPAHIFTRAADQAPRLDQFKLPSFDHLVPKDHVEFGNRMRQAMDLSDMIAVLKAAGLIPGDEGNT